MEILGANNPTQPTTPTHPPKPNQPLVNQSKVLEPSLGLDLIDSQSSLYKDQFPHLVHALGETLGLGHRLDTGAGRLLVRAGGG